MPRPLVLKITSNTSEPNKRATGTIDVTLFRENASRTIEHPPVLYSSVSLEEQPGLVRNLVNKYEPPGSHSTLLKYKSKSMMDLNDQYKPRANDDFDVDDEISEERRNNFQQSLRRFRNPPGSNTLIHSDNTEVFGHDIRGRARKLLEATKHDYFWFNEVVELLKQIVNEDEQQTAQVNEGQVLNENSSEIANDFTNVTRSRTVSVASTNSHDDSELSDLAFSECGLKVNKMKQIYEERVLQKPHLFVELTRNSDGEHQSEKEKQEQKPEKKLKVPLKYFGKQDEESDYSTATYTDETQTEDDCGISTQQAPTTSNELAETALSNGHSQHDYNYESQGSNVHNEIEETPTLHVEANEEATNVSNTGEELDETSAFPTEVNEEAVLTQISDLGDQLEGVSLLNIKSNEEEKACASNLLKEASTLYVEAPEEAAKTNVCELDVEESSEAEVNFFDLPNKLENSSTLQTESNEEDVQLASSNMHKELENIDNHSTLQTESNDEVVTLTTSNLYKQPEDLDNYLKLQTESNEEDVQLASSNMHKEQENLDNHSTLRTESDDEVVQLTTSNFNKEPEDLDNYLKLQSEPNKEAAQLTASSLHKEPKNSTSSTAEANEEAVRTIEEIMTTIEECDKTIDTISKDNKMDANYLNDILIQMLMRLDDLKIYDDGVILTIRRKAFAFAEGCIRKLKAKVFNDDHKILKH